MPNGKDEAHKKVKDLPFKGKAVANAKVADLTVQDLRDLEKKFKGEMPANKKLDSLTMEDYDNIEEVFGAVKREAFQRALREGPPGVPTEMDPDDWSISCCSCTPCCCCAAAEVDPFASSVTEARSA